MRADPSARVTDSVPLRCVTVPALASASAASAGADADVGSANTLLFTYEREVAPNVGIELVLGVPPTIKARASGSVAFLGEVLSAKNVAPTLIVNYHFNAGQAFRPYLGAGVNYTKFTDIESSLAPKVEMSDSVGPVIQAGLLVFAAAFILMNLLTDIAIAVIDPRIRLG